MGIYDRAYYGERDSRRGGMGRWSPAGGSSPKTWSITLWLIVINVSVFVLGAFPPLNKPYDLPAARVMLDGVPADVLDRAVTLDDIEFDVQTPEGELLKAHPIAAPVPVGQTPKVIQRDNQRRPVRGPNGELYEAVGQDVFYQVPGGVLGAIGHFSTFQGFVRLEVWRLVTFQFLHANFMHLLLNMFGLWFFGGRVEEYLGKRRFTAFYLMCGICGGLLYLILNGLGLLGVTLPGVLNVNWRMSLVGASAGVFGVIVACAKIAPDMRVQLIFPPIPLKMKFMAYGYVALSAFNLFIAQGANQGGDAAHIGGAIAGYFFIRNTHLLRDFFDIFGKGSKTSKRPRKPAKPKRERGRPRQEEIDRILEKVSASGLHSLTDKEKSTLEQASRAQQDS